MAACAFLAACGVVRPSRSPATTRATRPAADQGTTARPASGVPGTYHVGLTHLTVTWAPGVEGPPRELPTAVWYPLFRAGGPYPLLVFSQGYDLSVQDYAGLLEALSSAGFVVAAPTYPHTDPSAPASLDEGDIVNHPGDLRSVAGQLMLDAARPGGPLSGLVRPGEVGLLGHSDGGDVALAVAYNSCCRDSSVKALAVLSGAELASFGGAYFGGPPLPMLVVQGSADTVNVPACSTQIYDAAPEPKYYLDLLGAEHEPPYLDPGTDRSVVTAVTARFFAAEMAGETGDLAAMAAAGDVAGTSVLSDGPSAPPAQGTCPGAPG